MIAMILLAKALILLDVDIIMEIEIIVRQGKLLLFDTVGRGKEMKMLVQIASLR